MEPFRNNESKKPKNTSYRVQADIECSFVGVEFLLKASRLF
jgi:hypothetical protein